MTTLNLRDPERCPDCRGDSEVVESRKIPPAAPEYRRRRRRCTTCGHTWPTYETVINPKRLIQPAK